MKSDEASVGYGQTRWKPRKRPEASLGITKLPSRRPTGHEHSSASVPAREPAHAACPTSRHPGQRDHVAYHFLQLVEVVQTLS